AFAYTRGTMSMWLLLVVPLCISPGMLDGCFALKATYGANGPLLIGLLIRSVCPVLWLHAGQWCVWWSKWMCLIVRKANRLAHLGAKCWHSARCRALDAVHPYYWPAPTL